MLTDLLNAVSQFLTTAPLWAQVPLVLVVAVPLAAVFAVGLLRVVDASAHAWTRFWTRLVPGAGGGSAGF